MALLHGFAEEESERNAKRRKLDNGSAAGAPKDPQAPAADESDEGEDEEAREGKDLDLVEEPEENPADLLAQERDGEDESEDEDDEDDEDPFDSHFTTPDPVLTAKRVKAIQQGNWSSKRIMTKVSKAILMSGQTDGDELALPSPISSPQDLKLKQKIQDPVSRQIPSFDGLQKALAPILFNYHDILYGERSARNSEQLRQLTCLHAVNHVLK